VFLTTDELLDQCTTCTEQKNWRQDKTAFKGLDK